MNKKNMLIEKIEIELGLGPLLSNERFIVNTTLRVVRETMLDHKEKSKTTVIVASDALSELFGAEYEK